jgi:hypothetical protein
MDRQPVPEPTALVAPPAVPKPVVLQSSCRSVPNLMARHRLDPSRLDLSWRWQRRPDWHPSRCFELLVQKLRARHPSQH